jgi:hypothetical protein
VTQRVARRLGCEGLCRIRRHRHAASHSYGSTPRSSPCRSPVRLSRVRSTARRKCCAVTSSWGPDRWRCRNSSSTSEATPRSRSPTMLSNARKAWVTGTPVPDRPCHGATTPAGHSEQRMDRTRRGELDGGLGAVLLGGHALGHGVVGAPAHRRTRRIRAVSLQPPSGCRCPVTCSPGDISRTPGSTTGHRRTGRWPCTPASRRDQAPGGRAGTRRPGWAGCRCDSVGDARSRPGGPLCRP